METLRVVRCGDGGGPGGVSSLDYGLGDDDDTSRTLTLYSLVYSV